MATTVTITIELDLTTHEVTYRLPTEYLLTQNLLASALSESNRRELQRRTELPPSNGPRPRVMISAT